MSKVKRPQGKTTNKVIITFKDYSTQSYGTVKESFRCNTIDAADLLFAIRLFDKADHPLDCRAWLRSAASIAALQPVDWADRVNHKPAAVPHSAFVAAARAARPLIETAYAAI